MNGSSQINREYNVDDGGRPVGPESVRAGDYISAIASRRLIVPARKECAISIWSCHRASAVRPPQSPAVAMFLGVRGSQLSSRQSDASRQRCTDGTRTAYRTRNDPGGRAARESRIAQWQSAAWRRTPSPVAWQANPLQPEQEHRGQQGDLQDEEAVVNRGCDAEHHPRTTGSTIALGFGQPCESANQGREYEYVLDIVMVDDPDAVQQL